MKMYDNVLRRVRMVEEKNGIRYAKTDGKLYLALRIIYTGPPLAADRESL